MKGIENSVKYGSFIGGGQAVGVYGASERRGRSGGEDLEAPRAVERERRGAAGHRVPLPRPLPSLPHQLPTAQVAPFTSLWLKLRYPKFPRNIPFSL